MGAFVLRLCVAALAASACAAGADLLVSRCDDLANWSLQLGSEDPGARAKLALASDGHRGGCVRVDYTFAGGGHYTMARWSGRVDAADRIGFHVRLTGQRHVYIRVRDAKNQVHAASATVAPGRWQRVEVALDRETFKSHWGGPKDGKFHFPLRQILVGAMRSKTTGHYCIDDLYVHAASPRPEHTWRVTISSSVPSGIAFRGEPATYRIAVDNLAKADRRATLGLSTRSDQGEPREQHWDFTVPGWGAAARDVALSTTAHGYQELLAAVRVDGKVECEGASALAVVPRPPNLGQSDADSFFGFMFVPDAAAAERIGCKHVRIQAYWGPLERPKDHYLWDRIDRAVEAARAHGMSVVITLRPDLSLKPPWARWTDYRGMVQPENLAEWREFARDVTARYKDVLLGIEVVNEPDGCCWRNTPYSLDEAAAIHAKMIESARAGVHEAAPGLPILGLDTTGRDMTNGFEFSRAVLQRAAQWIDVYAGHPYSHNRNLGGGRRGETPEDSGLVGKLQQALDLMEEFGRPRRLWPTELGWALSPLDRGLSDASLEYAAYVARANILAKSVKGVEKLYWFCLRGRAIRGYSYGVFRGGPGALPPHYPLPAAAAYATCAAMLHHAQPAGQLALGPTVRAFRFDRRQPPQTVVALWATVGKLRLRAQVPASSTAVNSYGRRVGSGPALDLVFAALPHYITVPGPDADGLVQALVQARIGPESPVTLKTAYLHSQREVRFVLVNHTSQRVDVGLWARWPRTRATLAPGESTASLGLGRLFEHVKEKTLPVAVEAPGFVLKQSLLVPSHLLPAVANPRADGQLNEMQARPAIELDSATYVRPPDPTLGWDGPHDLSVKAWLGWSVSALYFAAQVRDDKHATPHYAAGDCWKSDSIQLAVDLDNDSSTGYDDDDREIGLVLGPDGPRAFTTFPKPPAPLAASLHVSRQGDITTYEAVLPWAALRSEPPAAGRIVAVNFIVNDNDGRGRSYWMGPTPGIGSGKSPREFTEFVLTKGE